MSYIKHIFILICVSFVCGIQAQEVVVQQTDNGKRISLEVGDTLKLFLEGNPTTGYFWRLHGRENSLLHCMEQSFASSSALCGAGGLFTLRFLAESEGSEQLFFVYERPWEKDVPPAQTFSVSIMIEKKSLQK